MNWRLSRAINVSVGGARKHAVSVPSQRNVPSRSHEYHHKTDLTASERIPSWRRYGDTGRYFCLSDDQQPKPYRRPAPRPWPHHRIAVRRIRCTPTATIGWTTFTTACVSPSDRPKIGLRHVAPLSYSDLRPPSSAVPPYSSHRSPPHTISTRTKQQRLPRQKLLIPRSTAGPPIGRRVPAPSPALNLQPECPFKNNGSLVRKPFPRSTVGPPMGRSVPAPSKSSTGVSVQQNGSFVRNSTPPFDRRSSDRKEWTSPGFPLNLPPSRQTPGSNRLSTWYPPSSHHHHYYYYYRNLPRHKAPRRN